jgi:transcriptional regulator with XRE-family HTH domain
MNLQKKLKNKEYRDSFAAEYIYSRIPLKIRAMRERRDLSQQELGKLAAVKQEWVCKLEDPNYGRLTLATLLKLASAFDVGLNVDFVPFSEILDHSTHLSNEDFDVASYDEEN